MIKTGNSIKNTISQAGKTVRDIQEACGVASTQAVYKWLRGDCLPTIENLATIADECNVGMEELLVLERV